MQISLLAHSKRLLGGRFTDMAWIQKYKTENSFHK